MMRSSVFDSPVGPLRLVERDDRLVRLDFGSDPAEAGPAGTPLLRDAERELAAYFEGSLRHFTIPIAAEGTHFQEAVWNAIAAIPYGKTATYGELAERIGHPRACRAVGAACGSNPVAIVIPCHRVVGSGGRLTGFGGGLKAKAQLLAMENSTIAT